MKSLAAAILFCGIAAGCSKANFTGTKNGQVRFSAQARSHSETAAAAPSVCGTFTLQPVSIDAAGSETLAGAPVVVTSTGTSQTSAILGCIDQGTTGPNPNWGYQVTAGSFVDCSTGAAIPGLSPRSTFTNWPIQCVAGQDVSLDISVDVSIAVPNSGGYIDISVGVDATTVTVGCKQADFQGDVLHFGSSWIGELGATAPAGVWGFTANSNSTQQFTGQVFTSALDQYATGTMTFANGGGASIVQAFMPACSGTYLATTEPLCTTTASVPTAPAAPSATTTATLADAFIADPAHGWAAATVQADHASVLIDSSPTLSPLPSGPTATSASPALADALAPQHFSDPSIQQFTGIWPALDAFGFVFTSVDSGGTSRWGHLAFDSASSLWTMGAVHPLGGMSGALAACVGLFATHVQTCQATQNDCSALLSSSYPPKRVFEVRSLVKLERNRRVEITLPIITAEMTGALYLPDASGRFMAASPVTLTQASSGSASQVFSGRIDCSAAIAGKAQGFLLVSVSSLNLPTAAGSPTLLGKLKQKVIPYDCDHPTDVSPQLAVPLADLDASNATLTGSTELTGAMSDQLVAPITCGMDSSHPNTTVAKLNRASGFTNDPFNNLPTPSGFLDSTCFTNPDRSGDAVPCSSLSLTNEAWVDGRVAASSLGVATLVPVGQALGAKLTSIGATPEESASGITVRYDVPATIAMLPPNLDASCTGATAQARVLDSFVSGLNQNGDRFAYSVDSDDAAKTATIHFSAGAVLSTAAGLVNNTATDYAIPYGRNTVLDTCIDPQQPDTVYLTMRFFTREPTDEAFGIAAVTVDLAGRIAPIIDMAASSDPARLQAAQMCQRRRESGFSTAPFLTLGANSRIAPAPSPSPAPVDSWVCGTGGGGSCACVSGSGIAFGHTGGWFGGSYCKIDFVYLF